MGFARKRGVAAMRIVVASINFAPDHAGIGVYSTDFARYLTEQGDTVDVVTGFSYYPQWRKREQDEGRLLKKDRYEEMSVWRGYLYVPAVASAVKRLWHELTFSAFAAINFFRAGRADAVVVFTPPIFLALVALFVSRVWRCPLIVNVQDLPLDAALALGMLNSSVATRCLLRLESWIYRKADRVVTISPTMLANLCLKGVEPFRALLVPNWIDVNDAARREAPGTFLQQQPHARGKFTIAYAGNLGVKQGIDILLRAAKAFEDDDGLHIFIIGDGASKAELVAKAQHLGLVNVTFLPFATPEAYRQILADMDVMFVAQRSGAGNNFFPSKLLGLMAQRKPLLVSADSDSELAQAIREIGCGVVGNYDDDLALVANIHRLRSGELDLELLGKRGLDGVVQFDRNKVLGVWREDLRQLTTREPAAACSVSTQLQYGATRDRSISSDYE